MNQFSPIDVHWQIGDDDTRWWAVVRGAYVDTLPDGATVSRVESEQSLSDLLCCDGPVGTVNGVKAEAQRRILLIMDWHEQLNAQSRVQQLIQDYGHDSAKWPTDCQAANQEVRVKWNEIDRLRKRSDVLEKMDSIPADYRDDRHW